MLCSAAVVGVICTIIAAVFNSHEITDRVKRGRNAAESGNWKQAAKYLNEAVAAREACTLTWVRRQSLVAEAQFADEKALAQSREQFSVALKSGDFAQAARLAQEPRVTIPAYARQLAFLAAHGDAVIASLTDREAADLAAGKEPPQHLDGILPGCVDALRVRLSQSDALSQARARAREGLEPRRLQIEQVYRDIAAVPAPVTFTITGEVIDRAAGRLLVFGVAIPSDGDIRHEGAAVAQNANLLIETPSRDGDMGVAYNARHYYRGHTTSRNRVGGVVPVRIYGRPTAEDEQAVEQAERQRKVIAEKARELQADDPDHIRSAGVRAVLPSVE